MKEKKPGHPFFLQSWLRLVRIEHALMSAVGVVVGLLLAQKSIVAQWAGGAGAAAGAAGAGGGAAGGLLTNCAGGANCAYLLPGPMTWLLALAAPMFINIGAFALNDYLDIETDRANQRKDRPLVNGELTPAVAKWTGIAGLLIGIAFGWMLNADAGMVTSAFALLSVAYNYRLKDWPLVGNAYIALAMAIAFVFGPLAAGLGWGAIPASAILLSAGAFFAGLGREMVKTVQDMKGDQKARHSHSLPLVIGVPASLRLAALCYGGFAIASLLLLDGDLRWNLLTSGLMALSALAFLAMGCRLAFGKLDAGDYEQMRKASLYAMMLTMAAVVLAVV